MTINLPINVRRALYILTAIGTPIVAYLVGKGILDQEFSVLWSAEVAVVGGLAAFNTGSTSAPVAAQDINAGEEIQAVSKGENTL